MERKLDLEKTSSEHKGLLGIFEQSLRKFKTLMHILSMFPLYLVACLALGVCITPGVYFFQLVYNFTSSWWSGFHNFAIGVSIAVSYFLYGCSLIFMAPSLNFLFRAKLKEWRGQYYSVESLRWFIHNGLTYLARFTFLEFVTPSPVNILFYKMMGMKIGHGVMINSTWISDPSLIEIGDKTTIGGSVTIVAHYGQGGLLVISPVKIGSKCTIGLKASIMGGVEIGDGAKVLPSSVVLPKTKIPAGETWGGVPAQKIDVAKLVKAA